MAHKVSEVNKVNSTYYFIKAAIHYLLSNKMENRVYLDDHCEGFDAYREQALNENFDQLIEMAGATPGQIARFADEFNREVHAAIMFSERNISGNTCSELRNLCHITGKSGKSASGLIALKEKNNAQGLFDMGAVNNRLVGGLCAADAENIDLLKKTWELDELPVNNGEASFGLLEQGQLKNVLIFGEDPVGCAIDKERMYKLLKKVDFLVVHDLFMSETAKQAELVLPASVHFETGGSFTNTQKFIQQFDASVGNPLEKNSFEQLKMLMEQLGVKNGYETPADVMLEAASIMQRPNDNTPLHKLVFTGGEQKQNIFRHGCDYLVKRFEDEWERAFAK